MEGLEQLHPIRHSVVVPISALHRGVIAALEYAKSISHDNNLSAVYVDFDEETTAKLREKWERWGTGVKLVVLPSPSLEALDSQTSLRVLQVNRSCLGIEVEGLWSLFAHAVARLLGAAKR